MTAVNCTKKMLDEMRKRGEWPRPTSATPAEFIFKKCQQFNIVIPLYKWMENSHFIFFCIVWILSFIILLLNRQKLIESSAARLFIFHYIGIDIIIFITPEIIRRIYEEYFKATANWYENAQCLKNYRGEIIFNQYPNPDYVYYPKSIAKVKLILETIYENSQKFNHLRTCQLILHRIIVYLACTKPMWYRTNITTRKLAVYYAILALHCACHILNNAALHIFEPYAQSVLNVAEKEELSAALSLINTCRDIVGFIRKSKLALQFVKRKPREPVKTRWMSTLWVLEDVYDNLELLKKYVQEHPDSKICELVDKLAERKNTKKLNILIEVLKPFEIAISRLEAETVPTLHLVPKYFKEFLDASDSLKVKTESFERAIGLSFCEALMKKEKVLMSDIQLAACILYPPMRKMSKFSESERTRASDFLEGLCIDKILATDNQVIVKAAELPTDKTTEVVSSAFDDDDETQTEKETIRGEIERYQNSTIIFAKDDDLLQFWFQQKKNYPNLHEAAKVILAIPASEASAERAFRKLLLLTTDLRSRLGADTVRGYFFIIAYSPSALFISNKNLLNAILTIFSWLFTFIHIILTALSLHAVWKFKCTSVSSRQGLNEMISFLWFSILPCTLDIICAAGNLITDYWRFIFPDVDAFCVLNISNAPGLQMIMYLCDRIKMVAPVLMILFCITGYRRLIFKCCFFWWKPRQPRVQPIATTMAGNILSLATNFRNDNH